MGSGLQLKSRVVEVMRKEYKVLDDLAEDTHRRHTILTRGTCSGLEGYLGTCFLHMSYSTTSASSFYLIHPTQQESPPSSHLFH